MTLDTHVAVTLTINNNGVALAGFGLIGILTYKTVFPERLRLYSRASAAVSDGFAADSPEVLAITAALRQSPHPTRVALIRGDLAPTQRYLVECTDVRNSFSYLMQVDGEGVTSTEVEYESDSAATVAEVHNGLVTALNAVTGKNYTAAFEALVVADTTFVGEADDDTLTSATALVNADDTFTAAASDICTAAAHGLLTGDGPFQLTTTLADLPLNLLTATDYWIIRIDANTFYLAESVADAIAGVPVDIADAGTGVHTISDTAETRRLTAHGLQTGDGPIQVSNAGGALPTGLIAATDYWVIRTGANTFKLATTLALALAGTAQALSTDGTGVQTLADTTLTVRPSEPFTVTADAAGDWFSLSVLDTEALAIKQNHADPGLATDLAAIQVANSTWYYLHTLFDSDACILGAAAWAEGNGKMYYVCSNNTECENTAAGNGDALDDLEGFEYKRVVGTYYPTPSHMHGAGWMSLLGAYNPGKWSPAYKTIVGSVAKAFTETQISNLDNRKASYYKEEAGRSITWEGKVGNTSYLYSDITTSLDWFLDALKKRVFGILVAKPKTAYTDEDIAELRGAAVGVVDLGKSDAYEIIAAGTPGDVNDPVPVVTFPRVRDIDSSVRALRQLPNGNIQFRMQGAVHTVLFDVTVTF